MRRWISVFLALLLIAAVPVPASHASAGIEEDLFQEGMTYYHQENYEKAFQRFLIAGKALEYAPAQYMLGICYWQGLGTEQDLGEAEVYLRLAADLGNSDASSALEELLSEMTLQAPEILSVSLNSDGNIELAISPVPSEDKTDPYYMIFRATNSAEDEDFQYFAQTRSNTFITGSFGKGTTYYFNVKQRLSNGEWSGLSTAKSITVPVAVGDTITLGHYEKPNAPKQPVLWQVLDVKDGKALLISLHALDCRMYHDQGRYEEITWKDSSLRDWLNHDFYTKVFSEEERERILLETVRTGKNPDYNTDAGGVTRDRIFILSVEEATRYFSSDDERKCRLTAYATENGAQNDGQYCWWWLRTPGETQAKASFVNPSGNIDTRGTETNYGPISVRPAIWISIETSP